VHGAQVSLLIAFVSTALAVPSPALRAVRQLAADRPARVRHRLLRLAVHGPDHPYPSGTYYSNFAGVPNYVHSHGLGIETGGWAPQPPAPRRSTCR